MICYIIVKFRKIFFSGGGGGINLKSRLGHKQSLGRPWGDHPTPFHNIVGKNVEES